MAVDDFVMDCDIIIRQERLIVEFDDSYWHSKEGMYERDLRKTKTLQKAGWEVIRVREGALKATSSADVLVAQHQDMKLTANTVLLKIQEALGVQLTGLEDYLDSPGLRNSNASKKFTHLLIRAKRRFKR